jgi:hypothetical protein
MSNELEKRLRELVCRPEGPSLLDFAFEAARIGAEIEREACIAILHKLPGDYYDAREAIRVRGAQ